jgi:hypothetical protein
MRNPNMATVGLENGIYAWFGPGVLMASAVAVAIVVALWFTSMLFLVRGFVDAASSAQVMTIESGHEMTEQ